MDRFNGHAPAETQLAELLTLGERLLQQIRSVAARPPIAGTARQAGAADPDPVHLASEMLRFRRWRDAIFAPRYAHLFADPAWNVLLELFVAGEEDRAISLSSACAAACVPPTTAMRWIHRLERDGLIERGPDEQDTRRTLVRLTADARSLLTQALGAPATAWSDEPTTVGWRNE